MHTIVIAVNKLHTNASDGISCIRNKLGFHCRGCTPIKLGAVPSHFDKLFNERYDELLLESTPTKTPTSESGGSGAKIRNMLSRKRKSDEIGSDTTPSGKQSLPVTAPAAVVIEVIELSCV